MDGQPGARFVIELLATRGDRRANGVARVRARWREARRGRRRWRSSSPRSPVGAPSSRTRRRGRSRSTSAASSTPRRSRRESEGTNRVFMLTESDTQGGRMLRSVARDVQSTPTAVLEALILGPNPGETDDRHPHGGAVRPRADRSPPRRRARSRSTSPRRSSTCRARRCATPSPRSSTRPPSSPASTPCGSASTASDANGPTATARCRPTPLTRYDFPGIAESAQPAYPAVPSEPPA